MMIQKSRTGKLAVLMTAIAMLILSGCHINAPRARYGSLPSNTFGTKFPKPDKLGPHSFYYNPFEVNGLVYTCKGGHIDIYHIRGAADNTRHFINLARKAIAKSKKSFSYNYTLELSVHKVTLTYPDNWKDIPKEEKQRIAEEVSYIIGPYVAHNSLVWHEILTWYGTNFAVIDPELNSAFTWEDVYSNLIGVKLAVKAMQDPDLSYDKAMTKAIYDELERLDVQPKEVAKKAAESVNNKWYKGYFFTDMLMRNFDVGLDGSVTPMLVPGVEECDCEPEPKTVPTLDGLAKYGFEVEYEIKPNVFEQGAIFKAAGSKKIFPDKHFPAIMEDSVERAKKRGDLYNL